MGRHALPNCYAIAMAVLPEQRDVILIGQPQSKGSPACIAAIGLDEPHALKGPWIRPRTVTASCVAVLPGQHQFAVGGCVKISSMHACVCCPPVIASEVFTAACCLLHDCRDCNHRIECQCIKSIMRMQTTHSCMHV